MQMFVNRVIDALLFMYIEELGCIRLFALFAVTFIFLILFFCL